MKNFRMLMTAAVVSLTAASFFSSCNDDGESVPMDGTGFNGTYKLTSHAINTEDLPANPGTFISAEADLNDDGVFSHDLVNESTCFADSYIRFNRDHTYVRVYTAPDIFDEDPESTCLSSITEVGVWKREGDVVTITSSVTNGTPIGMGMEEYTMDFTVSGTTITGSKVGAIFPDSSASQATGKVDYSYVKQAE